MTSSEGSGDGGTKTLSTRELEDPACQGYVPERYPIGFKNGYLAISLSPRTLAGNNIAKFPH